MKTKLSLLHGECDSNTRRVLKIGSIDYRLFWRVRAAMINLLLRNYNTQLKIQLDSLKKSGNFPWGLDEPLTNLPRRDIIPLREKNSRSVTKLPRIDENTPRWCIM